MSLNIYEKVERSYGLRTGYRRRYKQRFKDTAGKVMKKEDPWDSSMGCCYE